MKFSAADDELLVELVAEHPILWNIAEKEFKHVLKKELIWKEIASIVNIADKQCKARWKNIRDHYKKQMKANKNKTTGSAKPRKQRWIYSDRLQFLDTVEDEGDTFSNANVEPMVPLDENEIQNDTVDDPDNEILDISSQPTPVQHSKKRQKKNAKPAESFGSTKQDKRFQKDKDAVSLLKAREEERDETRKRLDELLTPEPADEIDLFFQTMAATVKQFDPSMKTHAKMKVFNIITDMEMQNHALREPTTSLSTFNYETSLCASTTENSPYSTNNNYSVVYPVDKFLTHF